ncbi:MAG: CsbD family protein [Dermabacter sp.]|nr:CsbD family protein [Dermabacter sp.]
MSENLNNKAEDLGGRAKEAAGSLTDNDKLRAEGKADQASASLKETVNDVKNAVSDAIDKARGK